MIEYILKYVFNIFGKKNVKLVIYYGNKQGKDIDVFVGIAGKSEYNCIQQDSFDITYIGEKWLKSMIEHLDPLLTEPVLTGEVIYGNENHVKNTLSEIHPSESVIDYLINKSSLYFKWANTHFQNGDLVYACDCVRFSLGFYYFAMHYKKGGAITTFSTLLNEFNNERSTIKMTTKMAKIKNKLTFRSVECILTETRNILTKI